MQNFCSIKIPKGKKITFKTMVKVFGTSMVFDYSSPELAATAVVYLQWGIN